MHHQRLLTFIAISALFGAGLIHCSSDDADRPTSNANQDSGSSPRYRSDAGTVDVDASLTPYCSAFSSYAGACGFPVCDDGGLDYALACNAGDNVINSETFREAALACLTPANCDPAALTECEFALYATPTAAQTKLIADYCATCEPSDEACPVDSMTLPADAGAWHGVLFEYAWDYSDTVVAQIDSQCTGSAIVVDAGWCEKSFDDCAAGVLDSFPEYGSWLACQ